jgi:N-methylhydantoinase A
VLVPRNPGILCAMGLLLTDLRADFASTRLTLLTGSALAPLRDGFAELEAEAAAWFAREGVAPPARRLHRRVDMRYAGQNYEIAVPLPDGPVTPQTPALLAEAFAAAHQRLYGFLAEAEPVQLVTFRVEAIGLVRKAELRPLPLAGQDPDAARESMREVWLTPAGATPVPVFARDRLRPGNRISGPAVIEQMDSTTLLPPGWEAQVDAHENLVLEAQAAA